MKKGDVVPVTIQGIPVTNAVVEYVETDKVTLIIPATKVVMGVRMQFDEAPREESATETIIDGVDRAGSESATDTDVTSVESTESAPVVETPSTETITPAQTPAVNNEAVKETNEQDSTSSTE